MLTGLKLKKIKHIIAFGLLCHALSAMATATVASLNQCEDMIFIDGLQDDSEPSGGTGGSFPGLQLRTVQGIHDYYIYVPTSYQPGVAMPIMAVWHGQAGAGGSAAAALDMRLFWQPRAEAGNFIVVAQASTGASGGWIPGTDSGILQAIFNDMEASYNIERTRRYLWGFSAGGFVMHAIALSNADFFAAYAVSGAHLGYASQSGIFPSGASRQIPVVISVGQTDSHFTPAQNDLQAFVQAGWNLGNDLWFDDFVGGHVLLNHVPELVWDHVCVSTRLD